MKVVILDVDHGLCAIFLDRTNRVLMIDAGSGADPSHVPSRLLLESGIKEIELLIIGNYDEDHISDLPNLRDRNSDGPRILRFLRNKSISADQLEDLKRLGGPLSSAMKSLIGMIRSSEAASGANFANIEYRVFHNNFPDFEDTNNLSLLVFVSVGDKIFCFPGDLEKAGWLALIKKTEVQEWLKRTDFFVASHHGRESGYCPQVFQYCRPKLIIVSDKPIVHDTQLVDYTSHAGGVQVGQEYRFVLTTRKDGSIFFQKPDGLPWILNAEGWNRQITI